MNSLLLLLLIAQTPAGDYLTGGVVLPPDGMTYSGARVMQILPDGSVTEETVQAGAEAVSRYAEQLPGDDRARFNLTLFIQPASGESQALKSDFESVPALKSLRDWCNYSEVDCTDPSQVERYQQWNFRKLPAIAIYPQVGDPDKPYHGVFFSAGYGGDHQALAMNAWTALRAFYRKYSSEYSLGQCPGPGPCPRPDSPDDNPDYPDSPTPGPNWPSTPALPDEWPPKDDANSPTASGWPAWVNWQIAPWVALGLIVLVWIWKQRGPTAPAKTTILLLVCLAATPALAADVEEAISVAPTEAAEAVIPVSPLATGGVLPCGDACVLLGTIRSDLSHFAEAQRDWLRDTRVRVEVDMLKLDQIREEMRRLELVIGVSAGAVVLLCVWLARTKGVL